MARGNGIVVNAEPNGRFIEGILSGALKPGTIVQIDPSVALNNGRHTFKAYDRAASGDRPLGPLMVLMDQYLLGVAPTVAYTSGDRCQVYVPKAGDELNLLMKFGDVSDTHTKGEALEVEDATGKVIALASTPQSTPFVLLETITLTADALVWAQYSGY